MSGRELVLSFERDRWRAAGEGVDVVHRELRGLETLLEAQLAGQPPAIQEEVIRINTDARPRALQVAMLVPAVAGLLGLLLSFRMMRFPDPAPSTSTEGMAFG